MKNIILGTAGHIDHGKTTFVELITGINTDKLQIEKDRGITIELGFAKIKLSKNITLDIIDVPGHKKFIKNMISGITNINILALVIAANEGIMPQTKEHLEICQRIGIKFGLVILSKIDLIDCKSLPIIIDDIKTFLKKSFLKNCPIIPINLKKRDNIKKILLILENISMKIFQENNLDILRLPIDRVFTIKGFGTIVTGTIISGKVNIGDNIEILPKKYITKVRGIQIHNKNKLFAEFNHRVALNLHGINKNLITRGDIISHYSQLQLSSRIDVIIDDDFLEKNIKVKNQKNFVFSVIFYIGTTNILAKIIPLLDPITNWIIKEKKSIFAQILLNNPYPTIWGDKFLIKTNLNNSRIICGGQIVDPIATKFSKSNINIQDEFIKLLNGTFEEKIIIILKRSGFFGISIEQLAIRIGISIKLTKKLIFDYLLPTKKIVILTKNNVNLKILSSVIFDSLQEKIISKLNQFHSSEPLEIGISREKLFSQIFKNNLKTNINNQNIIFDHLLKTLQEKSIINFFQNLVKLTNQYSLEKKNRINNFDTILQENILSVYENFSLTPPLIKEVNKIICKKNIHIKKNQIKNNIYNLIKKGKLIKINNDIIYHVKFFLQIQEKYISLLNTAKMVNVEKFKKLTKLSRKYIIPLLEYFDKIQLTIRIKDYRILKNQNF